MRRTRFAEFAGVLLLVPALLVIATGAVSGQVCSGQVADVGLDLVVEQAKPGTFPTLFRVQVKNRSMHSVIGGDMHLVLTVESDPSIQVSVGSSAFAWGEFRLGPGEVATRVLNGGDAVLTGEHGELWKSGALMTLLARSRWSVFASAADETGYAPNGYPSLSVGSQLYRYEPNFMLVKGVQEPAVQQRRAADRDRACIGR